MKKTLTTLIATTAVLAAGTAAAAGCPFQKYHGGTAPAVYSSPGSQGMMIKTGGYGSSYTAKKMVSPDIVDTAASAGAFNTLLKAAEAAGLVGTLKSDGPFTVFAPTDAAFAKLPAGTLESLLQDKEKLAQILKYHVVPGKLDAGDVTSVSKLVTVEGSELPVDSIKIAKTDIMTSNGIIHVIDEVLIPAS